MVVGDNGALNEYNTLNWLCDDCLLENDLERVSYNFRFSTDILIIFGNNYKRVDRCMFMSESDIYILYNVHSKHCMLVTRNNLAGFLKG